MSDSNSTTQFTRRRRVPRRAYATLTGLLARGRYYVTDCLEIGEGGMLFVSPVKLEENQKVVVTLKLPGEFYSAIRGTVRYVLPSPNPNEKDRYGIAFDNIEMPAKRKIRSFVASFAETEAIPDTDVG